MSVLTLLKAGALEKARNVLTGGKKLGDAIRVLRAEYPNRGRRQNSYEDFRNVVRRAQRQIEAGKRLENATAQVPIRALPVVPSSREAPLGQREYGTIVVIDKGDGSPVDRIKIIVTSNKDLNPNEIRREAVDALNSDLRNDITATKSGLAQVDLTGEAKVDVIITNAQVRGKV